MLQLGIMIIIGALIGWITNKVAIKMLFRPVNPVKILFFKIQGVFPKRKDQMAISLAEIIENELLSSDVLISKILDGENIDEMKADIMDLLVEKIAESVPSMVKMFLGDNIADTIRGYLDKEGDKIFDVLLDKVKEKAFDNIDVKEIVKERIDELDFIEFEKIIFGLMSKELKHIEVIGFFLGGMIGALQYVVTTFI
jgi:uncharacterized membrane protein YheB (UPF0754 family)